MEFVLMLLPVSLFAALILLFSARDSGKKPEVSLTGELESRMEDFIRSDCFSLIIQPVMDFRSNTASGGEALTRLNHPERGMICPDEFLPCLESAGLHPQFDRYVFRKCCQWLRESLDAGQTLRYLSCNFSRKTLSDGDLAAELIQITEKYGIPCHFLAIEITERELETDAHHFRMTLEKLRECGFRIFLDDYGQGVTGLRDLMDYPLDVVKIDRSMLQAAETEQGKQRYRALVDMARRQGLEVLCEGIETHDQDRFAQEMECHYGQGFLFFKPICPENLFTVLGGNECLPKETA